MKIYFATNRDPNKPAAPTDFGTRPEVSSIPICGIEPTSAQGAVRRKGRSITAQRAVNNLHMRRMRLTISA
jgi:hypothetical protein